MKKIGIDVRMIGLRHAGIGRYIANLIGELKTHEFYLFIKSAGFKEIKDSLKDNFHYLLVDVDHYSLKEQLLMPWIIWRSRVDLIHFPHFNVPIFCPKPFVVTIHDLIKHQSRGLSTTTRFPLIYWIKYTFYLLIFGLAVKRAKRIIVPSYSVKKELLEIYNLNPEKIVVIYEGVEDKFKLKTPAYAKASAGRQNSKLLDKFQVKKPFIIYTGSLYPHKNIERLIEAIKSLKKVELIICCSRSVFWERIRKKIKKMRAERLVKLLGFIPDEELVGFYQMAVAFVQPSIMEGFDLTVVEAMAAGLPVVVSDIPVHREIADDAAVYFDPYDVNDMAGKIKSVLRSPKLRKALRQKGFCQAQQYSWQKMARDTLKVYEDCLL